MDLDALHLAKDAVFGTPQFRLSECSRWPERQGCGQECLKQIEAAPQGCLVRRIVADWYAGKTCVICGKGVDTAEQWVGHVPALLDPEKKTLYWDKIAPEKLPRYSILTRPFAGPATSRRPSATTIRIWLSTGLQGGEERA